MKLPNFTNPIYGVGEHYTKNFLLLFLNLGTVLPDSTAEKFANKLNEIEKYR